MKRLERKYYDSLEYDSLEEALIQLRNEKGVTQEQLSELIGRASEYAKEMDKKQYALHKDRKQMGKMKVSLDYAIIAIIISALGYQFSDFQKRVNEIRNNWENPNE